MLGCVRRPAARASVWNRARSSERLSPVPSSLRRMVFTATVRPITGSTALYTTPIAPRPSSPTISYLPAFATVSIFKPDGLCGHASADTEAPYLAQYPAEFRQVNATGVPVFRTRYLAVWSVEKKAVAKGQSSERRESLSMTIMDVLSKGGDYQGT